MADNKFNYIDPEFYGKLDDVIDEFSFKYYAYVKFSPKLAPDGSISYTEYKYIITGNLQTWERTTTYGDPSLPNVTHRVGKFYCKAKFRLKDDDIVCKNSEVPEYYRIKHTNNYDYGGIMTYDVERIGYDESRLFHFNDYKEATFEEIIALEQQAG